MSQVGGSSVYLGVCGWPVGHSLSPELHEAALKTLGFENWRYLKLPLTSELFEETVGALPELGFRGVNVTIPHKVQALKIADSASDVATAIGAANTLTFQADGILSADNTDAPGLIEALGPHIHFEGRRALVIGAGGSARAAVFALQQAGISEVMIFNRTRQHAEAIAQTLGGSVVESPRPADLLINCTSVGLTDPHSGLKALGLDADTVRAGSCVLDMVYRRGGTQLLREAADLGAQTVDGLEVLVAQAALSLENWTGRRVSREVMRSAIKTV